MPALYRRLRAWTFYPMHPESKHFKNTQEPRTPAVVSLVVCSMDWHSVPKTEVQIASWARLELKTTCFLKHRLRSLKLKMMTCPRSHSEQAHWFYSLYSHSMFCHLVCFTRTPSSLPIFLFSGVTFVRDIIWSSAQGWESGQRSVPIFSVPLASHTTFLFLSLSICENGNTNTYTSL